MTLKLDELETVRPQMLREVEAELAVGSLYQPKNLNGAGLLAWPDLLIAAIKDGDDGTLYEALLARPDYFNTHASYTKGLRRVNVAYESARLATSEFNTIYVRALSGLLITEGVEQVEIYRAAASKREPGDCARHEGLIVAVQAVYDGYRASYGRGATRGAFSVPFQAGCHHSIRRVKVSVGVN